MAKPSIFSKNYEKRVKRRRRRIAYIITTIIIVVAIGAMKIGGFKELSNKFNVKNIQLFSKFLNKEEEQKDNPIKQNAESSKNTDNKKEVQQPKIEQKSYNIKLSNNIEVSAVYEVKNSERNFVNLQFEGEAIDYNINPSRQGMIIYDKKAQGLIYVDIEGKVKDLSKKEYISTSKKKFPRETILKSKPGYIWCLQPRFIDDNNIAYLSQLPWLTQNGDLYVWTVNISNENKQNYIKGLNGDKVKFDTITDKGLTVNVDGKKYYLKSNGEYTN